MNISNQLKSLFSKEKGSTFDEVLIEILDDVFDKKKKLHTRYFFLVQKVWSSSRPNSCKVYLAKYILARLDRESERVLLKASILARRLCPNCQKKHDENLYNDYSGSSNSYH